jgi:hypothetical protein
MSVHWSIDEWRALGVDALHTYLDETPAEQIHFEAAAAYLELSGGRAAFTAMTTLVKAAAGVARQEAAPVEAERSAPPLPPRALVDRLLSLPEYQARGHGVALAGETSRGDTLAACTQRYILDNIEAGRSSDFYCLPLLYRHEGELWLSIDDQYDIEGEGACDPPQRVRALTPIAATDLIAVVGEDELFLMYRRDVEVQIGAQAA